MKSETIPRSQGLLDECSHSCKRRLVCDNEDALLVMGLFKHGEQEACSPRPSEPQVHEAKAYSLASATRSFVVKRSAVGQRCRRQVAASTAAKELEDGAILKL